MAVPSTPETITGRVASVNPKGVRLDGQDGWLNLSKYAPHIVPPMRGQTVTLTLDRQGFVRTVQAQDGPTTTAAAPGATSGQDWRPDARELRITRQAS